MIKYYPESRATIAAATGYAELDFCAMRDASENPLTASTYPKIPAYDTATTGSFDTATQTNAGTTTNIWWLKWTVPQDYLSASDLTLKIDGKYVLGGDAVMVAATIDAEVFPYDSTNGDYSNTDICATAANTLATSFGTESFTLTGTSVTPGTTLLIRLTSVIQITSAGGAGTGYDTFNFARVEYSKRI